MGLSSKFMARLKSSSRASRRWVLGSSGGRDAELSRRNKITDSPADGSTGAGVALPWALLTAPHRTNAAEKTVARIISIRLNSFETLISIIGSRKAAV